MPATTLLPRSGADASRRELGEVLSATLRREALRNERTIAALRAAALGVTALLDGASYLFPRETLGVESVPLRLPLVTAALAAYAVGVWILLRRGWYPGWVRAVLPLLDGVVIAVGFSNALEVLGSEEFRRFGGLATVAAACTLLAMGGGLRLSRTSVASSIVASLVVYAAFAVRLEEMSHNFAIQLALLALAGLAGAWVARIVRRTVQGAVARATLGRFLPAYVVEQAHLDPRAIVGEPRALEATVLVSDLRGFTTLAETLPPGAVLELLNDVQGRLAEVVRRHGGTVDKFLGDGLLAVFGTPEALPAHAAAALGAAREMLASVREVSGRRTAEGLAPLALGVGVHSGAVVSGVLGSGARMEFTVLGDTVNVASRLQDLTKEMKAPLLASESTVRAAGAAADGLVERGAVALRGRAAPLRVFALPEAAAGQ